MRPLDETGTVFKSFVHKYHGPLQDRVCGFSKQSIVILYTSWNCHPEDYNYPYEPKNLSSRAERRFIMPDPSRDLVVETEKIYFDRLRDMSGEERLKSAVALSEAVRKMAKAGIKRDHPGITDNELRAELLRRTY